MKKLSTTPISDTAQMPIKKGTLDFIQLAYSELFAALMQGLVENYQSNTPYVMYGCINNGSGDNYNISNGAIFLNGEIYLVDAASFTATNPNYPALSITTTQYTTDADPVTFSDSSIFNVHDIRKITIASGTTGINYSSCVFMNPIPKKVTLTGTAVTGSYPNYVVNSTIGLHPTLYAGSFAITDITSGSGEEFTVSFPNVGTDQYYVILSIKSNQTDHSADTSFFITWYNPSSTGFKIWVRENYGTTQNVLIFYELKAL